jgi:hypothetical protein
LAHGLATLNMMMHGWEIWGIDTNHVDLTSASVFPLLPKFEEGTVYLLAERLSPDYTAPGFSANEFLKRLQAAYMVIPDATMPRGLLETSSQRRIGIL